MIEVAVKRMWQAQFAELGGHFIRDDPVLPKVLAFLFKIAEQVSVVYPKTDHHTVSTNH